MNERIKELAKKAGFQSYITTHEEDVAMFEKFAELIVQECANFVREEYDHEHAESIAWTMEVRFGLHGDYA